MRPRSASTPATAEQWLSRCSTQLLLLPAFRYGHRFGLISFRRRAARYLYDGVGNAEQGQIASTRMYLETPSRSGPSLESCRYLQI